MTLGRSRRSRHDPGRVEAFSDGVFSIAITLLVLEIGIPVVSAGESLWPALADQWPSYAAYVVSFLVIGIMWANHHTLFSYIGQVDRTLIFLNLLLLMVVALLPWPTNLVADYLDRGGSQARVAVAVYSGVMVLASLAFTIFWRYVTTSGRLLDPGVDATAARASVPRFAVGLVVYPITVGLAFVSPVLTLAVHGALAVYYVFNQLSVPDVDSGDA